MLRTIRVSYPEALAFDGSGNLYVASYRPFGHSNVRVYAPGTTKPFRAISQGVNFPFALAFDGSGNLYVANYGNNAVTVYAPGEKTVLLKISAGVNMPAKLAFGP